MFKIQYQVISPRFDMVETPTEDELRYYFLLGDARFVGDNCIIDMAWGWIPLLDFSICLAQIALKVSAEESISESFEFTESAETITFLRNGSDVTIEASFSLTTMVVRLDVFDKEVNNFQNNIRQYIIEKVGNRHISLILKRYLEK